MPCASEADAFSAHAQVAHNYLRQDQLFHRVLHLPVALVGVSDAVQSILAQQFGRSSLLIPNGVDCDRFFPGPPSDVLPSAILSSPTKTQVRPPVRVELAAALHRNWQTVPPMHSHCYSTHVILSSDSHATQIGCVWLEFRQSPNAQEMLCNVGHRIGWKRFRLPGMRTWNCSMCLRRRGRSKAGGRSSSSAIPRCR